MLTKTGDPSPPRGIKKKLFRAPIFLYRYNLGFLLGERFICLKHYGRVSGKLNEAVIEVIDKNENERKIYCASGFGEKSQWFKNIKANNNVFITIRNTEYKAAARIVSDAEAEGILLRYAKENPKSILGVAKLSGYTMDGTEDDIIDFSKIIKIIEFSYA